MNLNRQWQRKEPQWHCEPLHSRRYRSQAQVKMKEIQNGYEETLQYFTSKAEDPSNLNYPVTPWNGSWFCTWYFWGSVSFVTSHIFDLTSPKHGIQERIIGFFEGFGLISLLQLPMCCTFRFFFCIWQMDALRKIEIETINCKHLFTLKKGPNFVKTNQFEVFLFLYCNYKCNYNCLSTLLTATLIAAITASPEWIWRAKKEGKEGKGGRKTTEWLTVKTVGSVLHSDQGNKEEIWMNLEFLLWIQLVVQPGFESLSIYIYHKRLSLASLS